ncbi:MAG: PQQ-dependent sugar dehydrogenase [Spirochaetota bacterium]
MKQSRFIMLSAVVAFSALLVLGCSTPAVAQQTVVNRVTSEAETFNVVRLASGLDEPWGIDFLPNGDALITERSGGLLRYSAGDLSRIDGVPTVAPTGQGGLLDVLVSRDFDRTGRIFLSYSGRYGGGSGTSIARGRLTGNRLAEVETIFRMTNPTGSGQHFGSRMVQLPDESVVLSIGDRGARDRAQDLTDHAGSFIRIAPDGSVPGDNPFVDRREALPEIYAYGTRNAQGLTIHPETGEIWSHEHGPQGGDEINVVEAGRNYGWPEISYGEEYGGGTIGPTEAPGMEQPITYWVPSIAPSGMDFYNGDAFPGWKGNLFVGALRGRHLRRVVLDGTEVVSEELIRLTDSPQRVRDVKQGPDGYLWILIDESNAPLYRLEPAR